MTTQAELLMRMKELYSANLRIAKEKNDDYAGDGDAFKNFRGCERHGISLGQGLLVRMEDKMARLGNLLRKPPSVAGESLADTARDLANYAAILAVWWQLEAPHPKPQALFDRSDDLNGPGLPDSSSGTVISFPGPEYHGNT
ncbi:MAG TPA: hypothetical protein VIY48_11435 [Candidatus Paceibacterota bacterium]